VIDCTTGLPPGSGGPGTGGGGAPGPVTAPPPVPTPAPAPSPGKNPVFPINPTQPIIPNPAPDPIVNPQPAPTLPPGTIGWGTGCDQLGPCLAAPPTPGGNPAPVPVGTDPITGRPIAPVTPSPTDPITGQPVYPVPTQPVDPVTGQPVDPVTGQPINPVTGQPIGSTPPDQTCTDAGGAVVPCTSNQTGPATPPDPTTVNDPGAADGCSPTDGFPTLSFSPFSQFWHWPAELVYNIDRMLIWLAVPQPCITGNLMLSVRRWMSWGPAGIALEMLKTFSVVAENPNAGYILYPFTFQDYAQSAAPDPTHSIIAMQSQAAAQAHALASSSGSVPPALAPGVGGVDFLLAMVPKKYDFTSFAPQVGLLHDGLFVVLWINAIVAMWRMAKAQVGMGSVAEGDGPGDRST